MKHSIFALSIAAALAAASCFSVPGPGNLVNRAMNQTVDSAANRVGDEVGKAVAADILARNPHLIQSYAMGMFNVMFYQGGYYFDSGEYAEGEYTAYQTTGLEQGDFYEKTLLREQKNGNQWWRVETHSKSDQQEGPSVVVMEALFGPPSEAGDRKVLRMRALLPGEEAPREIPITEQNAQSWYLSSGNRLTKESREGMTVGQEKIETPAGAFTTEHLQTTAGDTATLNWYLSDKVPGQLVKFARTNPGETEPHYEVTLKEYGTGRTESKLGIDLNEKESAVADTADETSPE